MTQKLSRREFHKALLAAGTLPVLDRALREHQEPSMSSGYVPTAEEQTLADAFLEGHNGRMRSLRDQDLPNSLAPAVIFSCPAPQKKTTK